MHTKDVKITKPILWDFDKNIKLLAERGLSFEAIEAAILGDALVGVAQNESKNHQDQCMFVLDFDGYIVLVPYVETEKHIFLKTAFYSRKATRDYLKEKSACAKKT